MNPEIKIQPPNKTLNRLTDILFYSVMFIFIVALAFPHNPSGNWYQQFMPSIGDKQINDIIFLDSLTGIAIASRNVNPDTSSILRTTNGGDSWQIISTQSSRRFSRVKFVNSLTGFISGGSGSGTPYLYKTIDGGNNWSTVPGATFGNLYWNDMSVVHEDTIWLVDANSLNGGVFRTTNGGASWDQQLNLGNLNPNHIYMFNGRIGFIAEDNSYLRKTTDGGLSWNVINGADGFTDIYFADSLTGWKCFGDMEKTTDGGLNWISQTVPFGGNIVITGISKFSNVNVDTLWGVGGTLNVGGTPPTRGILYYTKDGGSNWLFQLPDTAIHISRYSQTKFLNTLIGWAYSTGPGIHTTNGGDTTFLLPVNQINTEVPKEYMLYQNYPNPFNPKTNIKYQIPKNNSSVLLTVFDLTGREIATLVNQKQSAGTYEVDFDGSKFASGLYFYSLIIDNKIIDTKKMIFLK